MIISRKDYQYFIVLCFLFFCFINSVNANQHKDIFYTVLQRIQKDCESKINIDTVIERIPKYLVKYEKNKGSFHDINYDATDRTYWPPIKHIERLYDLTFAYTIQHKNNPYFENASISKVIDEGLKFWCKKDPSSSNWWHNQIGEPQLMGQLIIQLRKSKNKLPKEIEAQAIERLAKKGGDPRKWTGANKTDIALHWLYRACLTKDKELLEIAISEGFLPVKFAPFEEGLQPDYSYFQHGQQLYIGGYGDEFLKGVLMFAEYTANTEYEIDPIRLSMIRNFVLQTYYKVIRGKYIHMNVLGRGISRKDITRKNSYFAEKLIKIDPSFSDEYTKIVKRISGKSSQNCYIKPSNTTYYIADYVIHTRPEYAIGIRTTSIRTMRNEYGNGENLNTYFLSDGSTHITQEGDEYFNIFPVWDWSRIPGVTNPYYEFDSIPIAKTKWRTRGTEKFVGGASDSLYSVNTYRLNDRYAGINTSAYKSWFFFDEEIVCLGTGITSESELKINTTVEQNILKGKITAYTTNNKEVQIEKGTHVYDNNLKWVLHNNRGYLFPLGGKLSIKNEIQKGDWNKINTSQPTGEVSEKVFSIWFDHGNKPVNEKYVYIIVPNKKNTKELKRYNTDNILICSNNDSIQAVYNKKLNILEMVFLKPSEFLFNDISIKSDHPAAIIIKKIGEKEMIMHIADPTQSEAKIELTVLFPSISKEKKVITIDMQNSGHYAGKTRMYRINTNTPN